MGNIMANHDWLKEVLFDLSEYANENELEVFREAISIASKKLEYELEAQRLLKLSVGSGIKTSWT